MALDQSALLEVLEALKAADVDDRIRAATEALYQALIEAELTAVIGAGPQERTETRIAQRNGSRPRILATTAGDLEPRIPKLRAGSFFPSLLERRRRIDKALFAVVMEAYLHGVSTRKVDDLVKALGADSGISNQAVVIATGVAADGHREVLGVAVGDSEDGAFWTAFLRSLKARGLSGTQLVISDAHRAEGRHRGGVARRQLAAVPGAFHAQRAGPRSAGQRRDGRRGDPHRVRPARRRTRPLPAGCHRRHARTTCSRKSKPCSGMPRMICWPSPASRSRTPKLIWSTKPAGAAEQGDQAPHRRRRLGAPPACGALSQPRGPAPPGRRRAGRGPRRMAGL
jgi:hypothetical protein